MEEDKMTQQNRPPYFFMVALGALWGCSEAVLGMVLKTCASMASGSVMTAVALFFISAAWAVRSRLSGLSVMLAVAVLFKIFDVLLISVPFSHRAVVNPVYAMVFQGLGFCILVSVLKNASESKKGRILLGGGAALFSAVTFIFAGYITGVPACIFKNTGIPLSIVFLPVALGLSMITVPLGYSLGPKMASWWEKRMAVRKAPGFEPLITFGMVALGILMIAAIHLLPIAGR